MTNNGKIIRSIMQYNSEEKQKANKSSASSLPKPMSNNWLDAYQEEDINTGWLDSYQKGGPVFPRVNSKPVNDGIQSRGLKEETFNREQEALLRAANQKRLNNQATISQAEPKRSASSKAWS